MIMLAIMKTPYKYYNSKNNMYYFWETSAFC